MTPESWNSGACAGKRLAKHVPRAMNKQATIEIFLSYNDANDVFC
jgi:hypothetical protein